MTDKPMRAPAVPPAELEALARRLADLAGAAGVSPAELARRAGLTDGAVRHYLAGRTAPALGTLLPLAKALGCRPSDLLADWPAGSPAPAKPTRKRKPPAGADSPEPQ